jgi:cold shock CspA family protein
MVQPRYTGELKFWSSKGFGFIQLGGDERDVFVHLTACIDFKPQTGDRVSFGIVPGDYGDRLRAVEVRLAL